MHNALIEIDGPEVPILDGSSAPFVRGIMARGIRRLAAPVLAFQILQPISVEKDGARATLLPSDRFQIEFHIDFADAAIGRQSLSLDMRNGTFARELCDSRTFCRQADVDSMHANGLALGGTLDNAVVVDGDEVLSPGGFRYEDEAVRHKMLDALGDLSLALHRRTRRSRADQHAAAQGILHAGVGPHGSVQPGTGFGAAGAGAGPVGNPPRRVTASRMRLISPPAWPISILRRNLMC